MLSQKQADGWYHPVAYGSRALTPHEKNYHSTKLGLVAPKWVVTEHFKEYLPYQSFLVRMDNIPLSYIMMTPNLNAMGHWWIGALVWFKFELEYQKGSGNTVTDTLNWVATPQTWIQWNQSSMESPWEQCIRPKFMTPPQMRVTAA